MRTRAAIVGLAVTMALCATSHSPHSALAQKKRKQKPAAPIYQRVKVYDFHQDRIDAQQAKPAGQQVRALPLRHAKGVKDQQIPRAIAKLAKRLATVRSAIAEAKLRVHLAELYLLRAGNARARQFRASDRAHGLGPSKSPAKEQLLAQSERHKQAAAIWTRSALGHYTILYCGTSVGPGAVAKAAAKAGTAAATSLACKPSQRFAGYKQLPHALSLFADTLQDARRDADARVVWQHLIGRYPRSTLIAHAYLALGDYNYADNRLARAGALYRQVFTSKPASLRAYAHYKLGWLALTRGKPRAAMSSFATVIHTTKNQRGQRALVRAAKSDFVRAFADGGSRRSAYDEFHRLDPAGALSLLERLGGLYADQGKAVLAMRVFAELQNRAPNHSHVCRWQSRAVKVNLSRLHHGHELRAIEAQVKLYLRLRQRTGFPKKHLAQCYRDTEETARQQATIWHREANKTLNAKTLEQADRLYALYLATFGGSVEYGMLRYYHAELLWNRAERERNQAAAIALWERAARAHSVVAKDRTLTAKIRKESAYAAALGWKNAVGAAPHSGAYTPPARSQVGAGTGKPMQIPQREREMLAAFAAYRTQLSVPDEQERVTMLFLEARVYWRFNHVSKAVPLFEQILDKHSKHDTAESAAKLLLDALNQAGRHRELFAWANKLSAMPGFLKDKDELAKLLRTLNAQGKRKQAEALERDGKYDACSRAYFDLYRAAPSQPAAHELLYNAGVCAQRAGSVGAALRAYSVLRSRFPRTQVAKKSFMRTAALYEQIAWFDRAAASFHEYARKYGGERDAEYALARAYHYYRNTGAQDQALRVAHFYVKQYMKKRPRESAAYSLAIAEIHQDRGEVDKAIKQLRFYLRQHGRSGGVDRKILVHIKLGHLLWRKACPLKKIRAGLCAAVARPARVPLCGRRARSRLRVSPRSAALVAEAHKHFAYARKRAQGRRVFDRVPEGPEREALELRLRGQLAGAELALADAHLEGLLGARPAKLSATALGAFSLQEQADVNALAQLYRFVKRSATAAGSGQATVAAARLAMLYQQSGHRLAAVASTNQGTSPALCKRAETRAKLATAAAAACLRAPTRLLAAAPAAFRRCEALAKQQPASKVPRSREKTGPAQARTPFSSIEPAQLRYRVRP